MLCTNINIDVSVNQHASKCPHMYILDSLRFTFYWIDANFYNRNDALFSLFPLCLARAVFVWLQCSALAYSSWFTVLLCICQVFNYQARNL